MSFAGASNAGSFGPMITLDSHDLMNSSTLLGTTAPANTAWPAASIGIFVPFSAGMPVTLKEAWVETGTLTTSNNMQIAVYGSDFTRKFTTGNITVATASDTVNSSAIADVVIPPGEYYMALSCDGTRNILATTLAVGVYQSMGVLEQTGLTAATLPDPMVPVTYTRAFLPLFGLNLQGTAL